jgi:hypothetical protein
MGKLQWAMVAMLTATVAVQAGEAEKFFSERVKDFGTVPFGPTLVHQFKITNTTNQVVRINSARVSCGCVSASIPVNVLQPGQSTYLTANMDTKRFVGPKEVIVYVSFGQPFEEVTLAVRANRNDSFSKSSEAIVMGQVRKGAEGAGTMQITMRGDPNFDIRGASSATDYVKAGYKLIKRDRTEVVFELTATLKPGLDVGMWTTDVMFQTSNPSLATVRLPVNVEVIAPITATPALVQFPVTKVGDTKEVNVVVKGDKPFMIVDVKGGDGLVSAVAAKTEMKDTHVVRLVFAPTAPMDLSREIVVVTDGKTEVTIPVRGKAKMPE